MKDIKLLCTTLILVFLCFSLGAQNTYVDPENTMHSIANIDDLFIPYGNPSLLSSSFADGAGFGANLDKDEFLKQYWLFSNADGLAYIYEKRGRSNYHNLALGAPLGDGFLTKNIYVGTRYSWKNASFGKGWWRSGVTLRPHNSLSLAMVWDNPYKQAPLYRFGAAVRPLELLNPKLGHRLELSADINYNRDPLDANAKREFKNPLLGVNAEVLNGLKLGAAYDLDTQNMMFNFSLRFGRTNVGNLSFKPDQGDLQNIGYLQLGVFDYKPFMGIAPRKWHDMKLSGSVVSYKTPTFSFGPFTVFDSGVRSVEEVIGQIEQAANEPGVEGILLINPSFSTSLALMQELMRAFEDFKATGKHIACYYDNLSNAGYVFAASIADKIWFNPMGILDLKGLALQSPYFGDLLNEMGIEVLNFRSHKYKNAGNIFSESSMTQAEREVYDSILQSYLDEFIAQISKGRAGKIAGSVEAAINEGPYFNAQDALAKGLVDGLVYQDELPELLKDEFGFRKQSKQLANYHDYNWHKAPSKKIAVIYAQGNIVMGKGKPGKTIAAETTVDLIRKARNNPQYKGIILRVDSGGGSAQASDIILRELVKAQTENKMPVVVSMAGAAASGGYYIACKADKIVAEASTLTGSIGVIGLAFNAERMFNKIRINWSTVKKGDNSDFPSLFRQWSDAEKKRMTDMIELVYDDFVGKVADGRPNLSLSQVHEYAQGRVWSGKQAYDLGLVDDLGGMDKAVEHMRQLTGIKGEIELVDATSKENTIDINMKPISLTKAFLPEMVLEIEDSYKQVYELWKQYEGQNALLLCPVQELILDF
ncbi:MAG TPA: signal peptide peptidase SppA [Candidatus Cloacimonetes bacterium]|jgi:protease-4|nr:signal peptide peptidase SppA [Candidatus Cloacimonas sp.]HHZ14795.1 signal peptide peptidase SppA [Candidatus Cloacimonadota bacterium]